MRDTGPVELYYATSTDETYTNGLVKVTLEMQHRETQGTSRYGCYTAAVLYRS